MSKGRYQYVLTITDKKEGGRLHVIEYFDTWEEADAVAWDRGNDWNHREYGPARYDIVVKRQYVRGEE